MSSHYFEAICRSGALQLLRTYLSSNGEFLFPESEHVDYIDGLLDTYKKLLKTFKCNIVSSHLRLCFNQWCTARRFGRPDSLCPFCENGEDSIEHCITCSSWQQEYHSLFRVAALRLTSVDIFLLGARDNHTFEFRVYLLLYAHFTFHAYNYVRLLELKSSALALSTKNGDCIRF